MKRIILLVFFILLTKLSFTQVVKDGEHEFYFGFGTTTYQGQFGSKYDGLTINNITAVYQNTLSEAFCIGYRIKPEYSPFRFSGRFAYNKLSATTPSDYTIFKDYGFTTNMFELGLKGELGFHVNKLFGKKLKRKRNGTYRYTLPGLYLYLQTGVTMFYANPHGLDKLALDGRFRDQSFVGVSFPVGIGLRYDFNQFIYASFETSLSYTNSSYLDGLKTESQTANDSYHNNFITIGYKIQKRKRTFR
ncbi:MAG: hypothetical protein JXA53_10435 [Bacteroidales bacterium]|nr:hypothetical protein [Bacteroidales bacterium]